MYEQQGHALLFEYKVTAIHVTLMNTAGLLHQHLKILFFK